MRKTYLKSIFDRYKQSSKGLLSAGVMIDNTDLSKTNSDTPSRKTAFFVPRNRLTSQVSDNQSIKHLPQFTGVIRHILDVSIFGYIPSYDWKTSQNSSLWVICGADTVSSESDSNHPIFNSVVTTQNLTGGHIHA